MTTTFAHNNLVTVSFGHRKASLLQESIIISSGVFILSVLAQISIPLPFTPVPITAQTLGILVIGSTYGRNRAFTTILLYVLLGLGGLPIFSEGKFGIASLLGPTGGYLIGFILAGSCVGYLGDKMHDRKLINSLLIFLLGHVIIFTTGMLWLAKYVGIHNVLVMGLYPFLPGLVIKTVFASLITTSVWKLGAKKLNH